MKRVKLTATKVINMVGGQTALANELSALGRRNRIGRSAIHQWVMNGDLVPPGQCWPVEQVLRKLGKGGTRFDMRPEHFGPDPRLDESAPPIAQ